MSITSEIKDTGDRKIGEETLRELSMSILMGSEKGLPPLTEEISEEMTDNVMDGLLKKNAGDIPAAVSQMAYDMKTALLSKEAPALALKVGNGDIDSFWPLWRMFYRYVYLLVKGTNVVKSGKNVLPRLDENEAADLTGIVRNKLITALSKYRVRKDARFDHWLRKVAVNEKIAHLKRAGKTGFIGGVPETAVERGGGAYAVAAGRERDVLHRRAVDLLPGLIGELTPLERTLIENRKRGRPYKSLSEVFQSSPAALRKACQRAREKLALSLCKKLWRDGICHESGGANKLNKEKVPCEKPLGCLWDI